MSSCDDLDGPAPTLLAQPAPKRQGLMLLAMAGLAVSGLLVFASVGSAARPAPFDLASRPLGPGLITTLDDLAPEARASALASLKLAPPQQAALERQLDAGHARLAVMAFWDDAVEDGDVVTINAAGVTQTVAIRHGLTPVLTPYVPGGVVRITGAADGGDIVTVAMMTSGGPVPLRRVLLGETIEVAAP